MPAAYAKCLSGILSQTFKARPRAGLFLPGTNRQARRAFFARRKSSRVPDKLRRLLIAFTFPCS
ncbi:MAG: hypothetical protein CVT85_01715 [Alphaproteobacteria bacterium HGW-Alphaproteobacteria-7]|jgi:hypothetical protein|nr:MAG: hypothetical protein CVT85_01715 [Alphaproteobacteria bacterium HGW-Alphaproteobacteria-7]